jgi:hypothetical protein
VTFIHCIDVMFDQERCAPTLTELKHSIYETNERWARSLRWYWDKLLL